GVADGVAAGPVFGASTGDVVRGRTGAGCVITGCGTTLRAGAARCTGAIGVSLEGSWPLLAIALSIRSVPFSSLLIRIPFLSTVTPGLPVTCCIRFWVKLSDGHSGKFFLIGSGSGIGAPMM